MATRGLIGFNRGLNTKASAFSLGQDQMTSAQNVMIKANDLYKINGNAFINSVALNSGASVTGICDWQAVNQNRFLIIVCGNKIYKAQNLGVTPSDITGSATITASNNNQHTFASLNNFLAIFGGTDTPLQWAGSSNVASLAGSPPSGSLVVTANNFMFISGNTTNPSRVYWSNVSDPNTWSSANNIDFRASDGDIVTAIAPLGQNLAIFKRRSTGILYTQTTSVSGAVTLAPLNQVNTSIGCAGSQAWDALPDGRLAVFCSDAHMRIFDGTNYLDISDTEPPQSNIQNQLDALNIGRLQYACVKYYPTLQEIWLSVSTGSNTMNDSIFIYNMVLGIWECVIPDRPANILATSIDTRAAPSHPVVMLSGDYGGFVYEHDTGSVNVQNANRHIDGYATVSVVITQDSDGRSFIPKSIKLPLEAQATGQLQVGWGYDGLNTINRTTIVSEDQGAGELDVDFVLDITMLAGPSTLIQQVPINAISDNHTIQIQFRNQFAGQPFIVHPFWLSEEVST